MLVLSKEEYDEVLSALRSATDFFVARDDMNSYIHLAEPRYSPITEKTAKAWHIVNDALRQQNG